MILKAGQDHVIIEDLGEIVDVIVAKSDPKTNPDAHKYLLAQVGIWELSKARANATTKDGVELQAFPVVYAVSPNRIHLFPSAAEGYWLQARYYPPMKETP